MKLGRLKIAAQTKPAKIGLLFSVLLWLNNSPAWAQIAPDQTLGSENSVATPDTIRGLPSDRISGGAVRGSNLFHSFGEFNIQQGRGVYFSNPDGITNIITRVTGNNKSQVFGTLGVLGNANLFLINPQGIAFGTNARLDLQGSFLASTANSVVFNNFQFSASNPQTPPLLTVNVPIGLQFTENPGRIVNQSKTMGQPSYPPLFETDRNIGLGVQPGQTLALVGGDIDNQGGNLTASSGQILLASIESPDLLSFAPTPFGLRFNYDNIKNFGNIQISNGSVINTIGIGGGKIDVAGGNINLSGSRIYGITLGNIDGRGIDIRAQQFRLDRGAQILIVTLGSGASGNAQIHASDLVDISGLGLEKYKVFFNDYLNSGIINPFDPNLTLATGTLGNGLAGNINIDTRQLLIRDGAVAGSVTFGTANAGAIAIRANVIDIVSSILSNAALLGSSGFGGDISVETDRLTVRDGSFFATPTHGSGASGNITIKAEQLVSVRNSVSGSLLQTYIGTSTLGLNSKAGNLTIYTKRVSISGGAGIASSSGAAIGGTLFSTTGGPVGNLTITATESVEVIGISEVFANGSQLSSFISANTTAPGRGGNIKISTPVLTLRDGGVISTASLNVGDAGDININADRLEAIGSGGGGRFPSKIEASGGSTFNLSQENATGNAGSLNLNANQLILKDGATINVRNVGLGRAGNIKVVAQDIILRRQSQITTDAGSSNGGNIDLKGEILVALPRENSDITANARTAQGGRVTIDVPNIVGFAPVSREQVRDRLGLTDAQFSALQVSPTSLLSTSDIAAISQASPNLQGTVTFSTIGINPAQGLVELPQNVVDPAALIATNPCIKAATSQFTIVGRGGLPVTPSSNLVDNRVRLNWSELPKKTVSSQNYEYHPESTAIVPANGWIIDGSGNIILTAFNSNPAQQPSQKLINYCEP